MKRLTIILLALAFSIVLIQPQPASAKEVEMWKRVLTRQHVLASGTSTYIIDLTEFEVGDKKVDGDFTIQLTGTTPVYAPLSGATVNVTYELTNDLSLLSGVSIRQGLLTGTSNISTNLEGDDVVTNLAYDATEINYLHGFWPDDVPRYLILNFTSGVTDMYLNVFLRIY